MNYLFNDYEDAVLTALADLAEANGGYLKHLGPYAGEFSNEQTTRLFFNRFPGILVNIPSANYERYQPSGRGLTRQTITIALHVASRSWRNQGEARSGNQGVYTILWDIRDRLHGKTLGLTGIFPLEISHEVLVSSDEHTILYRADYLLTNPKIALSA